VLLLVRRELVGGGGFVDWSGEKVRWGLMVKGATCGESVLVQLSLGRKRTRRVARELGASEFPESVNDDGRVS
jgi:hypothetical protein